MNARPDPKAVAKPIIPSWTAGGRIENLADPSSIIVDFAWISATLSGLARFNNKQDGPPLSVAQHSVQGADALWRESGDPHVAGLFLLHDGHESWIQDQTTPVVKLFDYFVAKVLGDTDDCAGVFLESLRLIKQSFDAHIYAAAGYLAPEHWTELQRKTVASMDRRMGEIEAYELFGPSAFGVPASGLPLKGGAEFLVPHSGLPAPKLTGSICPAWAPMKAEEEFNKRLKKYCGIDVRVNPRGIAR